MQDTKQNKTEATVVEANNASKLITANQPLIFDIKQNPQPIIMESLCVNCRENGETIFLLTKIPFFKQILIGSFYCESCGFKNNQVQFVGELPSRGINVVFKATKKQDISRQLIKSEHATINFVELGLQIPKSKKAQITTIQGILLRVHQELSADQSSRKVDTPQQYNKLQQFLDKLEQYRNGQVLPFTMKINDPSGNSSIKNPYAPKLDENMLISYPTRTMEQIKDMGYSHQNAIEEIKSMNKDPMAKKETTEVYEAPKKMDFNQPLNQKNFMAYEASTFQIDCHVCAMPGFMRMCSTSIPYFDDLIIMSFSCEHCGAHSAQTKNSGEIGEHASTITLNGKNQLDLKRDLFKSQTCKIIIPELQLQLDYGTLGGVFTTVEGLIQKIASHFGQLNEYSDSDSEFSIKIRQIIKQLEKMMNMQRTFTLIMRDPLAHSFLQNPFHPEEDIHATRVTDSRTEDETQFLGLNDMKV